MCSSLYPAVASCEEIEMAITIASNELSVNFEDVIGKRRFREITTARQYAVALILTRFPGTTLSAIGEAMGGRDHSTIINQRDQFYDLYVTDDKYRDTYESIVPIFLSAIKPKP
jgi:chromosomal replication initiator protein